ncbi:MAG: toxic anion resistance protein [Clostridia bacterium]|nr:toxic anion resistance protein [Clostridia bacterium]
MDNTAEALPGISLTQEDRERIREIAGQIDLNDASLCLTYGTAGQKKLASAADQLFRAAGREDSAQIGDAMNRLIGELRDFSAIEERRGLFAWLFRRRDLNRMRKRYESAVENTDRIAAELENHRNRLLRDFVMLNKLYDSVLEQYRELTVLTEAGQRKLDEDGDAEKELRERFEKRLHDLKLSRTVCMQTLTQIRVLQGCNTALSEKIQSLLTNTMALWKNQTALALAMKNTGRAMEEVRAANGEMIGVLTDVWEAEDGILQETRKIRELTDAGK